MSQTQEVVLCQAINAHWQPVRVSFWGSSYVGAVKPQRVPSIRDGGDSNSLVPHSCHSWLEEDIGMTDLRDATHHSASLTALASVLKGVPRVLTHSVHCLVGLKGPKH